MNSQIDVDMPPPPPPPTVDCCEKVASQCHIDAVKSMSMDAALEAGVSANATEIEKLQANDRIDGELIAQFTRVQSIQDAEITKLKAEVDDSVDAGAFKVVIDKLNERIDGLASIVSTFMNATIKDINEIDDTIAILENKTIPETNHSHPAWMYKWGIVK